jgi:hypothetical protein
MDQLDAYTLQTLLSAFTDSQNLLQWARNANLLDNIYVRQRLIQLQGHFIPQQPINNGTNSHTDQSGNYVSIYAFKQKKEL